MQTKQTPDFTILLLAIVFLIAALCSCSRNGYGCKGNSNIMTRVR